MQWKELKARLLAAGINQDAPGPLGALQRGFHALAIIPAIDKQLTGAGGKTGDVSIRASTQPLIARSSPPTIFTSPTPEERSMCVVTILSAISVSSRCERSPDSARDRMGD